jgi:hypothetical protein
MGEPRQDTLFPDNEWIMGPSIVTNERCHVLISGQDRVVMVLGVATNHFRVDYLTGKAYAMQSLVKLGHARQVEIASAFGCSEQSVHRYQRRFRQIVNAERLSRRQKVTAPGLPFDKAC